MGKPALLLAVGLLVACRREPAPSGGANPGVVPPGAKIHGKSYGERRGEWWKFVHSIPSSDNPLLHDDKCAAGQAGPVWFLTGKWGNSPITATRHCTVPFGKYLFFPVVNIFGDNVGYDPPKTIGELRSLAREMINAYVNTKCWLDGRELQGLSSVVDSPYRAVSPVFKYRVPAGGLRGFPPHTLVDPVISDGVFLMLEPLPAGQHTIRFTASSLAMSYTFDITYHIDVAPQKK